MEKNENEPMWEGFPKYQLLRIIMQLLSDMGYSHHRSIRNNPFIIYLSEAVKALERESNCCYKFPSIALLEESVLKGDTKTARGVLSQLTLSSEIRMACTFLLSQHSYASAVYRNDLDEALKILRDDLSKLVFDEDTKQRLATCSSIVAYPSIEEALRNELHWEHETAHIQLWSHIKTLLSPEWVVPQKRLMTLLQQAIDMQELYCPNHLLGGKQEGTTTLYEDHACPDVVVPSNCVALLEGHCDEVWDVAASPDGQYFVTGARDGNIILWSTTKPFDRIFRWRTHRAAVCSVSWSSDSVYCASIDKDGVILLWMPEYPSCVGRVEPCYGNQFCLSWLPGRHAFVLGGLEREIVCYEIQLITEKEDSPPDSPLSSDDEESEPKDQSRASPFHYLRATQRCTIDCRARCIAVNFDGTLAVMSSPDRVLRVVDLDSFCELEPLPDNGNVTNLVGSALHNHMLVSVSGRYPVMRLWDLTERRVIQTYRGHIEDRYVLKCAFGGHNESFVLSGSEDSQIYIWSKVFGTLLKVVQAHTSTVNSVAWNIQPGSYMYSVSDDRSVGVWEIGNE
ncbi:WD repeat-containing protein 26 [Babesia sp. Xinjiang]|uniref:WD repeat-containing protein 26 n=1 Tax=Babesia sp. Xinjiang TaxID=462227 RepID=UPI000A2575C2|nr:WD repeat-containing protein 26 [Babesia sp. Xinjiang]ORM40663.1 WD repeat-containing protein 26 [Babesia sp. Xinjiang]